MLAQHPALNSFIHFKDIVQNAMLITSYFYEQPALANRRKRWKRKRYYEVENPNKTPFSTKIRVLTLTYYMIMIWKEFPPRLKLTNSCSFTYIPCSENIWTSYIVGIVWGISRRVELSVGGEVVRIDKLIVAHGSNYLLSIRLKHLCNKTRTVLIT